MDRQRTHAQWLISEADHRARVISDLALRGYCRRMDRLKRRRDAVIGLVTLVAFFLMLGLAVLCGL